MGENKRRINLKFFNCEFFLISTFFLNPWFFVAKDEKKIPFGIFERNKLQYKSGKDNKV